MSNGAEVSNLIAPHFHDTFLSLYPHQIDKGGRASTKSSKNPLKCIVHMLNDESCNVVVIKQAYNTIRQSVYQEFKRAFRRLGMVEGIDFYSKLSPYRISISGKKNAIYFGGLSDYEALKGMIPDEDTIKIVYLSEISQFKTPDDIDQVNATFSRGNDDYFITLYEYNPPKNKYHWVNVWCDKMGNRDDVQITHTDYTGVNPDWLGKKFIQEAENMKRLDESRYNWIYKGVVTGLDGLVFDTSNVGLIDSIVKKERILFIDIGIDTGHMTSATVFVAMGTTSERRLILLDTYFYSPNQKSIKKPPSEFSKDLYNFENKLCKKYKTMIDSRIIDSAEGGIRNQYFADYGLRLKGVSKEKNETMYDYSQELFSSGKFSVLNNLNNKIFSLEHQNASWKDGSVESGNPAIDTTERKITDKMEKTYYNDNSEDAAYYYAEHTVDAFKYLIVSNLRKYNLKQ